MPIKIATKTVTTRKARNCFGCGRFYERGSTMHVQVNVDGVHAYSLYHCAACNELTERHWMTMSGGDDAIYEGYTRDVLENAIPKTPEELLHYLNNQIEIYPPRV